MQTYLVRGIAPLSCDDEIVAILNEQGDDAPLRIATYVGILNTNGVLYRVVVARSRTDAVGMASTLRLLNLNNRIRYSDRESGVCDAVTMRAISTSWHSVMQLGFRPWPLPNPPVTQHPTRRDSGRDD